MRLATLPFRFKVLVPQQGIELTYLRKLGVEDVKELSSRLSVVGYSSANSSGGDVRVMKFVGRSSSIRLMPRGLLIAVPGTFERLGSALDVRFGHPHNEELELSWEDNDYQRLVPIEGGLSYIARTRHFPSRRRFPSEIARVGPELSPDELLMVLATAEACGAKALELLTSYPGSHPDLSPPLRSAGGGFLHHVTLPAEELALERDAMIQQCLRGSSPIFPLPNSSVRLIGGRLPDPNSKGLDDIRRALKEWVSDPSYLTKSRGLRA